MCLFCYCTITRFWAKFEISMQEFHFQWKWDDFHSYSWFLNKSKLVHICNEQKKTSVKCLLFSYEWQGTLPSQKSRTFQRQVSLILTAWSDCSSQSLCSSSRVRFSGWAEGLGKGSLNLVLKERGSTIPFYSVFFLGGFQ